jgi:hypothetical protein
MERRMEADCSGGQCSPRAVAPRGRKEGRNIPYITNIIHVINKNALDKVHIYYKYYVYYN